MNEQLRWNKRILRKFLEAHYTTERLLQVIDHVRAKGMHFNSCCCFVGAATADHELQGQNIPIIYAHYKRALTLAGAAKAEDAYYELCCTGLNQHFDCFGKRNRLILPILLAELRRRSRAGRMIREEIRETRT